MKVLLAITLAIPLSLSCQEGLDLLETGSVRQQKLYLPVAIARVGDADFSISNIEDMFKRTNKKLTPANIELVIREITDIGPDSWSIVTEDKLEPLLHWRPRDSSLRLYLVKRDDINGFESWTYDPIDEPEFKSLYGGAIFIAEPFNINTDKHYVSLGYLAENDTLLHELGHVLMQESEHDYGNKRNFFHERYDMNDDTIRQDQIAVMRRSEYLIRNL